MKMENEIRKVLNEVVGKELDSSLIDYLCLIVTQLENEDEVEKEDAYSTFVEFMRGEFEDANEKIKTIEERLSKLGIKTSGLSEKKDSLNLEPRILDQPIRMMDSFQSESSMTLEETPISKKSTWSNSNSELNKKEIYQSILNGEYENGDEGEDEDEDEEGLCEICKRDIPLTRHHLIPRTLHSNKNYKKAYTREQLSTCINICRPCHDAVHRFIDEKTLGSRFNTLEKLLEHEDIQKWIPYISKQKVRLRNTQPRFI